ncbi:hypothetical protein GGG16DRAFT_110470 [Schizophyllum commune]
MPTMSSPSPPVSTASRPMTPPWQPLRLEDAWKALPFANADDLPFSDSTYDESPSAAATEINTNERRVRFGADMVTEFTVQVPEVAAEEQNLPQSAPMDVDESAREVDVKIEAQGRVTFDDKASPSTKVFTPTPKPAKLAHPTTAPGVPEKTTSRPKKKKTRPVSLSNPPLLPYMCRCDDCAARRAEFLKTIGRRTVRWDEWPWCMVGDGYGTWYEEEVTDSEGEGDE